MSENSSSVGGRCRSLKTPKKRSNSGRGLGPGAGAGRDRHAVWTFLPQDPVTCGPWPGVTRERSLSKPL
jgi:hypothetical protein